VFDSGGEPPGVSTSSFTTSRKVLTHIKQVAY
jgi:hypothetical protein